MFKGKHPVSIQLQTYQDRELGSGDCYSKWKGRAGCRRGRSLMQYFTRWIEESLSEVIVYTEGSCDKKSK